MESKEKTKELTEEELNEVTGGVVRNKETYKCELCNAIFTSKLQ